ncbi:MAG: hypothetical protein AAF352_09455, partial [Pseudomonadota bacterium]
FGKGIKHLDPWINHIGASVAKIATVFVLRGNLLASAFAAVAIVVLRHLHRIAASKIDSQEGKQIDQT